MIHITPSETYDRFLIVESRAVTRTINNNLIADGFEEDYYAQAFSHFSFKFTVFNFKSGRKRLTPHQVKYSARNGFANVNAYSVYKASFLD
jgi:hypothetical protein